jgi:hypothetical protein
VIHGITAGGETYISQTQVRFDQTSIYFDGNGDYLETADSDDWYLDAGDWTIDFWMRPEDNAARALWGQVENTSADNTRYFLLYMDGNNRLAFGHYYKRTWTEQEAYQEAYQQEHCPDCERYCPCHMDTYYRTAHRTVTKTDIKDGNFMSSSQTITPNQWHHVAVVRFQNNVTIYLNGTAIGTAPVKVTYNQSAPFRIGADGFRPGFKGHMDNFRLTKGKALWGQNFSIPPTINEFTASVDTVDYGTPVTLTWQTTQASTRTMTPAVVNPVNSADSIQVTPTATTTYTLYIENEKGSMTRDVTVRVNGGFDVAGKFTVDGKVGIGTQDPQASLEVRGTIKAKRVKVSMSNWADYVFEAGYDLKSLQELEAYIQANRRLPDLPSAQDLQAQGVNVADILAKQMQKIEELTLYLLQIHKQNNDLLENYRQLQKENEVLKTRVIRLEEQNNE